MILICPNCGQRSRVDGSQAKAPLAQVHCGGCGKLFYVSAAHREEEANTSSVAAQIARARARRGTQATPKGLFWHRARPVLAFAVPLALLVLSLWDLYGLSRSSDAQDMRARVVVQQRAASGVTVRHVRATPYAPSGGAEGLLVVGEVVGASPGMAPWVPLVTVTAKGAQTVVTGRALVGPNQTLAAAPSLGPWGQPAPSAVTLGHEQALPFVLLLELPILGHAGPWDVTVSL